VGDDGKDDYLDTYLRLIFFLPRHLDDRENSYAAEIPAIWKPMPDWIQEGSEYERDMVDFKRTKEVGLVSKEVVDKIAEGILRL